MLKWQVGCGNVDHYIHVKTPLSWAIELVFDSGQMIV